MSDTNALKLMALDGDDLVVISANCQDAVFKAEDINWQTSDNRFLLTINRFDWNKVQKKRFWQKKQYQRRRAVLHIEQVDKVQTRGIKQAGNEVYSLLSIGFEPHEDQVSGQIILTLANGAAINLHVKAIEMRLADFDAVWETKSKPRHAV